MVTGTDTTTDTTRAAIASLLRRATFGPHPGQVEELTTPGGALLDESAPSWDVTEVADALLGRRASPFRPPVTDVPEDLDPEDYTALSRWWLTRMQEPWSGLHEKMVWYWHGHFTSNQDKVGAVAMARQHRLMRTHALGNFRDFLRAILADPAMLIYLDADGSAGVAPNENLARELLELFTLGRGAYEEQDVREIAKVLAGWSVDYETGEAVFQRDNAYLGAVRFLGHRGRFTPADVADILCDQPACAPHVAGRLHRFLVGGDLSVEGRRALGDAFAEASLDIEPLVAELLVEPPVEGGRARNAIEWFIGAAKALDVSPGEEMYVWMLDGLGQAPFDPPNVAGWPEGDRWLSAALMLAKANLLFDLEPRQALPFGTADPAGDALAHCGVFDASDRTRAALETAYWAPHDAADVNRLLTHLVLTSPEFSLA